MISKEGDARRRECVDCGQRFTTVEALKEELERSRRIIADAQALAERIKAGG